MNFWGKGLFSGCMTGACTKSMLARNSEMEVLIGGKNQVQFVIKSKGNDEKKKVYYSFEIREGEGAESGKFQGWVFPNDKFHNCLVFSDVTFEGLAVSLEVCCDCCITRNKKQHGKRKVERTVRKGLAFKDLTACFFVFVKLRLEKTRRRVLKKEVFQLSFGTDSVLSFDRVENDKFDEFLGKPLTTEGTERMKKRILTNNPFKLLNSQEISSLKKYCSKNKEIGDRIKTWYKNYPDYYRSDKIVKGKIRMGKTDFFLLFDGTACSNRGFIKSNVVRFTEIVKAQMRKDTGLSDRVIYVEGVGTGDNLLADIFESMSGAGVSNKLEKGYRKLCDSITKCGVKPSDATLHIIGYSRGAFTALSLVSLLQFGIHDELAKQNEAIARYKKGEKPTGKTPVEFLGLFESVSCIYENEPYHRTDVTNVKKTVHLLSLNETRFEFFPTLPTTTRKDGITSKWFFGDHERIGGNCREDILANLTLYEMMKESPFNFTEFWKKEVYNKITRTCRDVQIDVGEWIEAIIFGLKGYIMRKEYIKKDHIIHPSVFSIIAHNQLHVHDYKQQYNLLNVIKDRFK